MRKKNHHYHLYSSFLCTLPLHTDTADNVCVEDAHHSKPERRQAMINGVTFVRQVLWILLPLTKRSI